MIKPSSAPSTDVEKPPEPDVGRVDSRLLLGRKGRIEIRHRDQIYKLRETRAGKLILTK